MPRMYTKVHNLWPNHADTYDLNRRGSDGFDLIATGDTEQVVLDALAIEVTNEMPGAQDAVDADWDTNQHTEDWVAPA